MSKETLIVFVYDTKYLQDEADDPVKAISYFHPSWVSDIQKLALCGQLMGVTFFLNDCFFKPRFIALQNGKFLLKRFQRFILAVGADRHISDYLLQYHADLLTGFIKLYHRNLQSLYEKFASPINRQHENENRKTLNEILYHIFETYIPSLQYNGNFLQNITQLHLPKIANHLFLEAMQILQCCQKMKGILGGAILYNNKLLATQLSDSLTKLIILSNPAYKQCTGEKLTSPEFHIPNGVQMLRIYINAKEYQRLQADAQRIQNLQITRLVSVPLLFQYNKRKLKRDKSLIFTHIPEEDLTQTNPIETSTDKGLDCEQIKKDCSLNSAAPVRPKTLQLTKGPNFFSNKSKSTITWNFSNESNMNSITFDETDSYPEYIGRTSICSTPMAENKVLAVGNVMSICADPNSGTTSSKESPSKIAKIKAQFNRSAIKEFEKFFTNILSNLNKSKRRNSLTDLQEISRKFSNNTSFHNILQTTKTDNNLNYSNSNLDAIKSIDNCKSPCTITDPSNALFNAEGKPISQSLFEQFLQTYQKTCWYDDKDELTKLIGHFREFDNDLKYLEESIRTTAKALKADCNLNLQNNSLQLENLSLNHRTASTDKCLRNDNGIPLTPLLAKLSVLVSNGENSSYESQTSNPSQDNHTDFLQEQTLKTTILSTKYKTNDNTETSTSLPTNCKQTGMDNDENDLQMAELYICSQQNMTLLLVMEEGSSQKQTIVQNMFDICVAKFPNLELQLNQTLNVNIDNDKQQYNNGNYNFICLNGKGDLEEMKGNWNQTDRNNLEYINRDFLRFKEPITDIILRTSNSIFYGYQLGGMKFLYKEPAKTVNGGIPPISDVMGNIATKAKTCLERDHSYVLF